MAGPTGRGLTRCQLTHITTKADDATMLILLDWAYARWPFLVPTMPPAKKREPPNTVWMIVTLCRQHSASKATPPAPAFEQGQLVLLYLHFSHKPPLAVAFEQDVLRALLHLCRTQHPSLGNTIEQAVKCVMTHVCTHNPCANVQTLHHQNNQSKKALPFLGFNVPTNPEFSSASSGQCCWAVHQAQSMPWMPTRPPSPIIENLPQSCI